MSIRNTKSKKAQKEEKARPDAMHRAVRFLLEQAKMNNRDITIEADQHIQVLDDELGNPKELEALKKSAPAGPVEVQAPPPPADTPQPEAQDSAALLRQSGRFRRSS
jgi:hypothetical protein